MNLFRTLPIGAAALALLAACGGADNKAATPAKPAASESTVRPARTTAAPATKAAHSGDLTPAEVAAHLADNGLGCDDYADKAPDREATTLAPAPKLTEGTCTINGVPASVEVFADKGQAKMALAQIKTVYREMLVAFGAEEMAWVIAGPDDRVWVVYEDSEETQPKPTDEQRAMLDDAADVLNGKVFTFEP
jgi:hypothetical protein